MPSPTLRPALLETVARRLLRQTAQPVLKVAVDGVDGAGKTTFADELAGVLRAHSTTVIRASIDGFHHPREVRYRLGRTSPEGFYRDSYNLEALKRELLEPLGAGGSLRFRTQVFDANTDQPVHQEQQQAQGGEILLLDGLFLHRPELRHFWDDSIFLKVDFVISVPRGAARGPGFGSADPYAGSNRRYVQGNRLYFAEASPEDHAGIVVNNNDLHAPYIEKITPGN
ncbi:uridine kinase [Deinococcus antarcticus]|uniref:Uridine kinase n=1 Tax=Deinococcus antarcticus TaxID=1298767 RepID=A0ABV8A5D1_9DEIO